MLRILSAHTRTRTPCDRSSSRFDFSPFLIPPYRFIFAIGKKKNPAMVTVTMMASSTWRTKRRNRTHTAHINTNLFSIFCWFYWRSPQIQSTECRAEMKIRHGLRIFLVRTHVKIARELQLALTSSLKFSEINCFEIMFLNLSVNKCIVFIAS